MRIIDFMLDSIYNKSGKPSFKPTRMKCQTCFQCLRLRARRGVVRRNVEDFYIAGNCDLRTDMTVSLTDGKNQSGPGVRFLGWMLKCLVKKVRCESFDN